MSYQQPAPQQINYPQYYQPNLQQQQISQPVSTPQSAPQYGDNGLQPSRPLNIPLIALGALAGVLALAFIILLILFFLKPVASSSSSSSLPQGIISFISDVIVSGYISYT